MSENSAISWTHHTFNGWSGCSKVSAGCANCYAAALPPSMRRGAVWGDGQERVVASESYWKQPLAWDRAAAKAGERHRVFASSVADVFEDRPELDAHRERLFNLIVETPNLNWLLLTKRPENMLAWWTQQQEEAKRAGAEVWWPGNAWAGTSVEDQRAADERIPVLLQVPARIRFLSMEPLLGPVDLRHALPRFDHCPEERAFEQIPESQRALGDVTGCQGCPGNGRGECAAVMMRGVDWIIAGGESGPRARPMNVSWVRGVRDQCIAAGVPFHFKQFGEWAPGLEGRYTPLRVGKKEAGRLLDGRTWDEVPHV